MYPNPQEALPLPPRPNVEHYRKLAKDLVKSCRSGDSAAIRTWAVRWIEALAALQPPSDRLRQTEIDASADRVAQFARTTLSGREGSPACALTDAQFVIARAQGFASWPTFKDHIESLARTTSSIAAFEAAVDAITAGDGETLGRLLHDHPELARAHSTREHRATLLHYVAANGVEGYRQVSPRNSAAIARILLDAGADVDAGAEVYGSRSCTTLGLVSTSAPPADAGVQIAVIDVLLEHGARLDRRGLAGGDDGLIRACLANGQAAAAAHLASPGVALTLVEAAGLGRIDLMSGFFDAEGQPTAGATDAQLLEAFSFACAYGRTSAVELLLDRGVDVDAELTGHGDGHTGLHVAAYHGHADLVNTLLARGARVDVIDKTWGTPPLIWALTGWSRASTTKAERFYDVVRRLVRAGAEVRPDVLEWDRTRADPTMRAALTGTI
jgi:ankyrin repeat protein